ncbi:uncharacterized protein ACR2FA_006791 [Aphomia sociella]
MATLEDEIRDLKEKNNELVQKVQYWKMAAASKENEKLELMKEINELRLKLSRIRSGGAAEARKLDAALQTASEEALSHLVQASSAVARTIELAKTYMQDRQEIDNLSPRWSNISGTPNTERVHRVPPMLMGGQSIQPVVSLSRTILNTSLSKSPNRSRNVTERAVPLHMLQDVYIPLTRIDADLPGNNMDAESDVNEADDSAEDMGFDDSMERSIEGAQDMSEGDDFEASNSGRVLKVMIAKMCLDEDDASPPKRMLREASPPLESPKRPMRFDAPSPNGATDAGVIVSEHTRISEHNSGDHAAARRARRGSGLAEPHQAAPGGPRPGTGAHKTMNKDNLSDQNRTIDQDDRLSGLPGRDSGPAPDAGHSRAGSGEPGYSRGGSGGGDSDSGGELPGEGRTRRPRKAVTYKEKPLNRKMRR